LNVGGAWSDEEKLGIVMSVDRMVADGQQVAQLPRDSRGNKIYAGRQ